MVAHVYKPRRRKNGQLFTFRLYRGRYRLEGDFMVRDVALGTADKQVAERKLQEIIREKEQERAGLIAPRAQRDAAQKKLASHLEDFIADLKAKQRSKKHILGTQSRISKLLVACRWKVVSDISAQGFVKWRSEQTMAPKTLNEYLNAICNLLNWMVTMERIERNPLERVVRVETRGKERVRRRAFSDDELQRLIAVCGPRRTIYLTAAYTGLRRGELKQLVWGDLNQGPQGSFLSVRSSTTKNKKSAIIPVHPLLLSELNLVRPQPCHRDRRIFPTLPKAATFKGDLDRAGLLYKDELGRQIDFHALRYTFATVLARAGVGQRLAQELMRHSDPRLTAAVYTDATQLPTFRAVANIPWFNNSPALGIAGPSPVLASRKSKAVGGAFTMCSEESGKLPALVENFHASPSSAMGSDLGGFFWSG